jgi:trigger factor
MIEVGSDQLIPGFEDNLVGMRAGETKTFRIPFPADYFEKDLAGKESEFTVTINEVKEKKLPALDDEMAKTMGYENVADLRTKAKEHLTQERNGQVDGKLRSDLITAILEKNTFDVPQALIDSQTRALAQDWAQELKRQGVNDQVIQQAIMSELEGLRKRAESQVRASLVLEAIAKKEAIEIKDEDLAAEFANMSKQMNVDEQKIREFYANDPGRKEDLSFRLRQERTIKFLLDKAKIKSS